MMSNRLPAMATFLKKGPRSLRLSNCTEMVIGISTSSKIIAAIFWYHPAASNVPAINITIPEM